MQVLIDPIVTSVHIYWLNVIIKQNKKKKELLNLKDTEILRVNRYIPVETNCGCEAFFNLFMFLSLI